MTTQPLSAIRRVHALRMRGMPWDDVAKACDVSKPTARKMLDDYWHHRNAGTLWTDIGDGADWLDQPSIRAKA